MYHLQTHEQFLELSKAKGRFIIWFSASWCVPCQGMDKQALEAAAEEAAVPLLYCDQTVNDETRQACEIRSFPTFVLFVDGVAVANRRSSETIKVCQFIKQQKPNA